MHTIGDAIDCNARLAPNSPAVVATGAHPLSYAQLRDYIDRIRSDLRSAGFSRADRIAVALHGGPQVALAIAAISCSAVAIPLDLRLTLPELDKRLALLSPAAIILLKDSPSAARTLAERKRLMIIEAVPEAGALGLPLRIPEIDPAFPRRAPDREAPAFILQTSGTTGEPKLIPYSDQNVLAAASRVQNWFALAADDRCLSVTPAYYAHGLTLTVLIPLITGGSIAFPRDASSLDMAEWFGELAPTWYSASPTLHRYVLDKAKSIPEARQMHSLRFVLSGGAPLPENVGTGLQDALGVAVLEHYGSSEAAQISSNLLPPRPAKPGTCGIPESGTIAIIGEDGCQAIPGEKGEVWVRGPTLISGYIDAPDVNDAAFAAGWFRTGDVGSLDEDGFLTLYGRKQELINRGGEKIAPAEIDGALMRHSAVAEAAAYAVPHPRLGEDVAAAVVLRPGVTVTPVELRAFLSSQLAWFKIPRRIVFQDRLPKGLTGKVQRQRLKESCP